MSRYIIIYFFFVFAISANALAQQSQLPCLQQSTFDHSWKYLGPFNTDAELKNQRFGAITAISVNPNNENEIYIGSYSSGLFYTNDQGKNWTCLTDNFQYPVLGVHGLLVDYNVTPHRILITTGCQQSLYDYVTFCTLLSKDGGKKWDIKKPEESTFTSYDTRLLKQSSDGKHTITLSRQDVLYSPDKGESWKVIFTKSDYEKLFSHTDYQLLSAEIQQDKIYFTTNSNPEYDTKSRLYKKESQLLCIDANKLSNIQVLTPKLLPISNNETDKQTYHLKLAKRTDNDKHLYVHRAYTRILPNDFYTLDCITQEVVEHTQLDKAISNESIYWMYGTLMHNSLSHVQYFCGTVLYKSVDSGKTFEQLYPYDFGENNMPHADIRSCFLLSSTNTQHDHIYLGTDGGLSLSADGGKTFSNLTGKVLPITQFYGVGVSPFSGIISAGSQDNSIMSYRPKTNEWIIQIMGDGYDVAYDKVKPQLAYGQYNALRMHETHNDVAPFRYGAGLSEPQAAFNKKTIITHKNGAVYFADREYMYVRRKHHARWEKYPLHFNTEPIAIAVSETDSNIIFLSRNWGGLYKSEDGGKIFTDISSKLIVDGKSFTDSRIHSIVISSINPEHVWISLGYLGNYEDPCKPNMYRVLVSYDGGNTWANYSDGLPAYNVSDLVYIDGTDNAMIAATCGGVFIREHAGDRWKLFSNNLPKVIISELEISYCRGTVIAATFGRGLWECSLPPLLYNRPLVIKKPTTWSSGSTAEHKYITRDIVLKKRATLTIDCDVHMAKGKTIRVKRRNQIIKTSKGSLLNDCGEEWGGIIVR